MKMSGKGGNCYVDHSLRVVRSQEAVDWELKQYSTDHLNDQANAVSGKGKGNPRKGKNVLQIQARTTLYSRQEVLRAWSNLQEVLWTWPFPKLNVLRFIRVGS